MHPSLILEDKNKLQKIEQTLNATRSPLNPLMGHRSFWAKESWWPDRYMDLQLVSPFIHLLTSHVSFRDICK